MEGGTTTVMDAVIAAMGDVLGLSGTILDEITGNPILLFMLAAGMIPIGFMVLRQLKSTAGA